MTADTPSNLVPKLRFPEFQDSGEWETRKLGDVVKRSKETIYPQTSHDTTHLIELENIESKTGRILGVAELENHHSLKSTFQAGDVLFGKLRPYLRKFARPNFQGVCTSEIWVLRSSGISSAFLFYLVQTERFVQLANISSGSRMPRAEWNFLAGADFEIPHPDEQRKIADCLGNLDELIDAEDRKLEALRQHKQGLMQQLFPQPGETQPVLRFNDFRDAPDWGQAALGTLLDRPPEYGVNAAAVPFSDGLPAYIRITDIDDVGRFAPDPRVSVDIEPNDDQFLQQGDIVLARTGASVDKSYRYRVEDGRLVFAGFLIRVRPNLRRLVPEFLSAYLSTWRYWDWVRLTSARSGQPGINGSEYASMPLSLPNDAATLSEQRKIADCFTVLDDTIAAQRERLRALRCHKNGILQRLFPTPRAR